MLAGDAYPAIGASAGVFGMLVAYALIFPQRRVMLLCPPIPMPAWLFATAYAAAYAAIQLLLGVLRTAPRVAHFAHLGGMIGAVALIFFWSCRPHHDALGPYNVFVAADIFGQVCWNLIRDRSTTRDAIGSAATWQAIGRGDAAVAREGLVTGEAEAFRPVRQRYLRD